MIGLLGGTFDPVHNGHLRCALEITETLALDELRLIPLHQPPHRDTPGATPPQRLALLEAAIAGEPRLRIDTRELQREGISYTVDTLRSLRAELGERTPLCLLLGSDAFAGFDRWREPAAILRLAHLVVMRRPGETPPAHHPERQVRSPAALRARPAGLILSQSVTQLDISATRIRALLAAGRSPRYLLPDSVLALIERQRLYR